MPRVVAFEDARAHQTVTNALPGRTGVSIKTPFLNSTPDTPRLPTAFLSQGDAGRVINPHFHTVDQFQIIAEGGGKFGRHDIAPYCVHFSRAYTPYGPLVGSGETGVSFFTLRSRFDPGAQYVSKSRDKLKQVPDRQPWQITRQIKFPSQGAPALSGAVELREIPDMKDDRGLFAYTLAMAPDELTVAPDPTRGDGQYLIVVTGSLWHDRKEHKAFTVVFIEPNDGPFALRAGAQGLEAIILNFPQVGAPASSERGSQRGANVRESGAGLRKWQCELCAFAYDEAVGMPDEGIPAGTHWEDVPEGWACPDCAASKSDFQMVEV